MEMSVEELEGGATLIALRGRLDLHGASAIELKFNATAGSRKSLIVDLSEVTYIASMGMRMFLLVGKTMAARSGKMALLAPVDDVATILRKAGIDTAIPMYTTRDDAVSSLAKT
jgi:anti-anti-sigma factor